MAELSNVKIQLVPSISAGYMPLLVGPFLLLEFDTAPSIVHQRTRGGNGGRSDSGTGRQREVAQVEPFVGSGHVR